MFNHDLYDSIGFHCTLTNKYFFAAMERKLRGTNVSPVQFRALVQLMTKGPMSQNRLNDILMITSATGARLADRMERDGWVVRRPDDKDRRVKILVPTEKAQEIWHVVEHLGRELIAASIEGVDPGELEQAKRVLAQIRENLEAVQ